MKAYPKWLYQEVESEDGKKEIVSTLVQTEEEQGELEGTWEETPGAFDSKEKIAKEEAVSRAAQSQVDSNPGLVARKARGGPWTASELKIELELRGHKKEDVADLKKSELLELLGEK